MGAHLQNVAVIVAEEDSFWRTISATSSQQRAPRIGGRFPVEAALELIENAKPNCAIQNAGVAYETAMRIAKRLNEMGIPYLIQSDHPAQKLPHNLKGSRFLAKSAEE